VFEREGLMDLWRLGQGEDGLSRLLADTAPIGLAPTVTGTGGSDQTGPAIPAADVVLAIAYLAPGCTRAQVDAHEAWRRAPGWGTPPAPSTISRAAKALEAEGLLVRASNKWTVTEKGQERAKLAAMLVAGETGQSAPTVEMSAAEQERQAEALAEAGELS